APAAYQQPHKRSHHIAAPKTSPPLTRVDGQVRSKNLALSSNIMEAHKASPLRFAICVDNSEYPASLELHKVYQLLSDDEAAKDGDLRVIDESGEDYLYPKDYFVVIETGV